MAEKIAIALVGCGNRGPAHADAVKDMEEYELVAVCDIIESRAKAASERFGVKAYTDLTEVLKLPKLDAIMLSTNTPDHAEPALECIAAKKHVVVEKPLCDSVASGKKMEAEAAKAGIVAMTGYNRSFSSFFLETVRLSHTIDPLQVVVTAQRGFFMPQFFIPLPYGGIMDALTHDIDMGLRAIGGEPCAVVAQVRRGVFRPDKNTIEFVNILVDLERDGKPVMACFCASMAMPKPKNVFQAVGSRGFVASEGRGEILCVRHKGFADSKEMIEPEEEAVKPPSDMNKSLNRLYTNFAQVIRGEGENGSTLRHGLRALAVGEAAAESAEAGKRVEVSL